MLNQITLQGNLVKEPFSTEKALFLTLAVERNYKKEGEEYGTDFLDVVFYGKTKETVQKFFHKGDQMLVTGRIATMQIDAVGKDGTNFKKTIPTIVGENFQFVRGGTKKETTHTDEMSTAETPFAPADDDLPFDM